MRKKKKVKNEIIIVFINSPLTPQWIALHTLWTALIQKTGYD